jgi:hypothetical protein
VKSYRDLEIYQLSYDLAVKVHRFTLKLPKYEQYIEINFFLEKYDQLGRKINKYIQYVEKEWR